MLDAISSGESETVRQWTKLTNAAGKMAPKGMITKTIKLDQVVEEGFHTLIDDKENHVKILVDVGGSFG